MPGYRTESCPITKPDEIEQQWLELQERADCSYFQSWGWIGTWLAEVAAGLQPSVVRVWFDGRLVGMGVFVGGCVSRRLLVRSDALFLNEYPLEDRNMVIEYNGLLADPAHQAAVYREAVSHLTKAHRRHDEIYFGALGEQAYSQLCAAPAEAHELKTLEESTTWSVDLDRFDQGVEAYLATLSKNRRAQMRRSFQAYEERGPLQLYEARKVEEALLFFDGFKALHTARWQTKGVQGAFANPRWEHFHRSLIRSRFASGEIQLIRVSNAEAAIGYLYNFIWRKRVYVLQTGFEISDDKRLMPGYVVHCLAIAYNKQKGMTVYDLMHGDSLYKRIMCNRSETLHWLVLQRKRLKFGLEDVAVNLVRALRRQAV